MLQPVGFEAPRAGVSQFFKATRQREFVALELLVTAQLSRLVSLIAHSCPRPLRVRHLLGTCPPYPRRLTTMRVNTDIFDARLLLKPDIVAAVADERPRHAELHHGHPEIVAVRSAQANRPAVAIVPAIVTGDRLALHEVLQR